MPVYWRSRYSLSVGLGRRSARLNWNQQSTEVKARLGTFQLQALSETLYPFVFLDACGTVHHALRPCSDWVT